jgi:hypothetical protein
MAGHAHAKIAIARRRAEGRMRSKSSVARAVLLNREAPHRSAEATARAFRPPRRRRSPQRERRERADALSHLEVRHPQGHPSVARSLEIRVGFEGRDACCPAVSSRNRNVTTKPVATVTARRNSRRAVSQSPRTPAERTTAAQPRVVPQHPCHSNPVPRHPEDLRRRQRRSHRSKLRGRGIKRRTEAARSLTRIAMATDTIVEVQPPAGD